MLNGNGSGARRQTQRALVESAFLAALAVVITLLAEYVPVIGFVAAFLGPVPVAVVVSRHGLKWGGLSALVATVVSMIFLDPVIALEAGMTMVLTGLSLGYGIRRRLEAQKTLLLMTAAAVCIAIIDLAVSAYVLGLRPEALLRDISESMVAGLEQGAQIASKLGGKPFDAAEWANTRQAMMTSFMDFLKQVAVALVITFAATQAYLNYVVSGSVLRRFKVPVNELPPFSNWIFPPWFGLSFFLANIVPVAFGDQAALHPVVRAIAMNVVTGLSLFMLLEALSLLSYYLKRAKAPRFLIILLGIYVFANPSLGSIAQMVGALDSMADFRRIRWAKLEDL